MYIRRIINKNVGPLLSNDLHFSFDKDGNPKPIILVGKNGSGKSTVISNVVDSLYELAGKFFFNVTQLLQFNIN